MIRMRRLRASSNLRSLVRETVVTKDDLVYPVFIKEGKDIKEPVASMPGIYQYSADRFNEELDRVRKRTDIRYARPPYRKWYNPPLSIKNLSLYP